MLLFVVTVQIVPVPGQLLMSGKPALSLTFSLIQLSAEPYAEKQCSYRNRRSCHACQNTENDLPGKSCQAAGTGNPTKQHNRQNCICQLPPSFYTIDPKLKKILRTPFSGPYVHPVLLLHDPVTLLIQFTDLSADIFHVCGNLFFFLFQILFSPGRFCQISFSGHFQHLHGPSHIYGTVAGSLVAGHVILQFTYKILSCNAFQLCHRHSIVINCLAYISQNSPQSSLFRIHKASVIFTEKLSQLLFFIKIPGKTIIFSLACEPHDPAIFCRIFPWFIFCICIVQSSLSPQSANAVKHGADKCMCSGFSTLIFTVKYVDPRRKLHIPVPDLPEIFYF